MRLHVAYLRQVTPSSAAYCCLSWFIWSENKTSLLPHPTVVTMYIYPPKPIATMSSCLCDNHINGQCDTTAIHSKVLNTILKVHL